MQEVKQRKLSLLGAQQLKPHSGTQDLRKGSLTQSDCLPFYSTQISITSSASGIDSQCYSLGTKKIEEDSTSCFDENDSTSKPTTADGREALFSQGMAYDMFRQTERDMESSDKTEKRFLQASRIVMFVLLTLLVLGSGVWAKLCLLSLIEKLNTARGMERSEYANKLMIVLIFSPILTLLSSACKLILGHTRSLNLRTLLLLVVSEIAQACGYCLLIFKVLPNIDMLRRCVIMMNVAVVPTFLSLLDNVSQQKTKSLVKCKQILMAGGAFLLQVAVLAEMFFLDFFKDGQSSLGNTGFECWTLPLSLFLISFTWWENFIPTNIRILPVDVCRLLTDLRKTRALSNVILMFVRICTILVYCEVFVDSHSFLFPVKDPDIATLYLNNLTKNGTKWKNDTETNAIFNRFKRDNIEVSTDSLTNQKTTVEFDNKTDKPALNFTQHDDTEMFLSAFWNQNFLTINIAVSSILCAHCAVMACKLYMQKVAFALPILFISPFSIGIIYFCCNDILPQNFFLISSLPMDNCTIEFQSLILPLVSAVLLWISAGLISYYIWWPKAERMAKLERIFIEPIKDSVFVDMNLLLRRKNELFLDAVETEDVMKNTSKVPLVYVCATMWHETESEMIQLLKSLYRLDFHCATAWLAEKMFKAKDPDKFQTEIHIVFDDAFELDEKTQQYVPNMFVKRLLSCNREAARSSLKADIDWCSTPTKKTTPYGGQLQWTLPGGTTMVIHLKDKNKARHRKRWSQILYMYYLLGFKSFGSQKASDTLVPRQKKKSHLKVRKGASLLNSLKAEDVEKAENTFILALDGDVDFEPESVIKLIDRMRKNKLVGAVCGRTHPTGSGPMVWYQKFEYAFGHWLQKATEHVFGCVLCCPGCFSLYRASALMDDNVIATYTKQPTEAKHYLQFEQGEDRWLCTLLLQQGYKLDYCAGADAYTHAPEAFAEFFQQRRRWAPSTMANLLELLSSWKTTVKLNPNISTAFMLYQFVTFITGLLAPGMVAVLIGSSYKIVLGLNAWFSFLLSVAPISVFMIICFNCETDTQLKAAAVFSSIFTLVMVIVTVGTIINIANNGLLSPTAIFLAGLASVFLVTGVLHPMESGCMLHCFLYFVTVPATFIFLTVYYMCNLQNGSWGTRELGVNELKEVNSISRLKENRNKSLGLFKKLFASIRRASILTDIQSEFDKTSERENKSEGVNIIPETISKHSTEKVLTENSFCSSSNSTAEFLSPDYWMNEEFLNKFQVDKCTEEEQEFWKDLINKYIYPMKQNKEHAQTEKQLVTLRNNVAFGYFQINLMFTIALLQLQSSEDKLKGLFILGKFEPIAVAILAVCGCLIMIQFIGMLLHRWLTFQHLISATKVKICRSRLDKKELFQEALKETQKLTTMDLHSDDFEDVDIPVGYTADLDTVPDFSDEESMPTNTTHIHNFYDTLFRPNFQTMKRKYLLVHQFPRNEFQDPHATDDAFRSRSFNGKRLKLYDGTVSRKYGTHYVNMPIQSIPR